jgi:restriction endonuclease S subunit
MVAVVRMVRSLDIGPSFGGIPWVMVFLQRFSGDITMYNNRNYWFKLTHALSDPDIPQDISWWKNEGKIMVLENLSHIKTRMQIELALDSLERSFIE